LQQPLAKKIATQPTTLHYQTFSIIIKKTI
jgi:hypothetical protein